MPIGTSFETSSKYRPVVLASVAYLFGILGGIFVILFERKNAFVIFHGFQSVLLGLGALLIQLLFVWNRTLFIMSWVLYFIFSLFMIYQVTQDAPTQKKFKCIVLLLNLTASATFGTSQ